MAWVHQVRVKTCQAADLARILNVQTIICGLATHHIQGDLGVALANIWAITKYVEGGLGILAPLADQLEEGVLRHGHDTTSCYKGAA